MAVKKEQEVDFDELDDIDKDFKTYTECDRIHFVNPILNSFYYNKGEDDKGNIIETWGIPKRTVTEIVAESGVGKSTLALLICKELLEQGYNIAYIDTEKGINMNILNGIGVGKYYKNKNRKIGGYFTTYVEADTDRINTLIQKLANTKIFQFMVVDSIGAMDSGLYRLGAGSVDNQKVGGEAKAVKALLKTINYVSSETNISFILINHLMQTIGTYIPQEKILGGRSTQYLVDVIIQLTKKGNLYKNDKTDKVPIGQKVEYKIIKSRFNRGECPLNFYILYGEGMALIPTIREIVEQVDTTFERKKTKLVVMRGGGNGSLYLKNKEYKFRGELQLLKLIGELYYDLLDLLHPRLFSAKIPNSKGGLGWYEFEQDLKCGKKGKSGVSSGYDNIDLDTGELVEVNNDFEDIDLTGVDENE